MQNLKEKRIIDKDYIKYINSLSCIVEDGHCFGSVIGHHTKTKGAGGNDLLCVPMCSFHHNEIHNAGRTTFQTKHGIMFFDIIERLKAEYAQKKVDKIFGMIWDIVLRTRNKDCPFTEIRNLEKEITGFDIKDFV